MPFQHFSFCQLITNTNSFCESVSVSFTVPSVVNYHWLKHQCSQFHPMARERSRSRDIRVPPRGIRVPRQPPPPRTWHSPYNRRRVLLLVNLEPTRDILFERANDAMEVTTRAYDHNVLLSEQKALFTHARLLNLRQIRLTTVEDLHGIVSYMFSTWGVVLPIDSMNLRWEDSTGDVLILRHQDTIGNLVSTPLAICPRKWSVPYPSTIYWT